MCPHVLSPTCSSQFLYILRHANYFQVLYLIWTRSHHWLADPIQRIIDAECDTPPQAKHAQSRKSYIQPLLHSRVILVIACLVRRRPPAMHCRGQTRRSLVCGFDGIQWVVLSFFCITMLCNVLNPFRMWKETFTINIPAPGGATNELKKYIKKINK